MIIHCHHSSNPVSGEMKRIINIDKDVAGFLSSDIIEVEFYSVRQRKFVKNCGSFTLSDKVIDKYYVPNIPRLGIFNDWYQCIVLFFLFLKYSPQYYIEEWFMPRGIKILKNIFKTVRFGVDIHGAAPEEFYYVNHRPSKVLERKEKYSLLSADFIICQSDEMKRHIRRKYNIDRNIIVYRCGVDVDVFKRDERIRTQIRKELNFADDETVFVYSGGMHKWQRVEDSIRFFSRYHSYNNKSKLLVLTKEREACFRILSAIGDPELSNATLVFSLSYDEVPNYLNAADVAFLLRDDDVMNAVASPTKLSEYMACGLPVLSTDVSGKWLDEEGKRYVFNIDILNIRDLSFAMSQLNSGDIADYARRRLSLWIDRKSVVDYFQQHESID